MSEVLHANIFFFISSFGVVLFTILTCIILYQVVKITLAVRRLVERIEAGSEALASDLAGMREYMANKGTMVAQLLGFFTGRSNRSSRFTRSRRAKADEAED